MLVMMLLGFMLFGEDPGCCTYEASSFMIPNDEDAGVYNVQALQNLLAQTPDTAITIDLDGVGWEYCLDRVALKDLKIRKPITVQDLNPNPTTKNILRIIGKPSFRSNTDQYIPTVSLFYLDLDHWVTLNYYISLIGVYVYCDFPMDLNVIQVPLSTSVIDDLNIQVRDCLFFNAKRPYHIRNKYNDQLIFLVIDSYFETTKPGYIYNENQESVIRIINTPQISQSE